MQLSDLQCTECCLSFTLASSLLKHFAQHAVQVSPNCENDAKVKRPSKLIPDLYPISSLKAKKTADAPGEESEENVDSGIEDLINPFFYLINMEGASNETSDSDKPKNKFFRKYKCLYCSKMFGWSTDLKRHTLIHTGERPFKCALCNSTFTRKFLLQKHQSKHHCDKDNHIQCAVLNSKLPPLKPIFSKKKARKQDKQKIKRKMCNESTK